MKNMQQSLVVPAVPDLNEEGACRENAEHSCCCSATAHLGRDVLGAQLCFHVGVIQLADERVCPGLARVDGHMHVVLPMPLPPFLFTTCNT